MNWWARRFILRLRDTSEYWQSVTPALSRPDKRVVMAETATCRVLMKVIVAIHVLCSICKEACTDEIVFHSGGSHGSLSLLYMNWDPSTKIICYSYYRLYMAINYCNEFLRESTEGKLKDRGVYDALQAEMPYYRAEARFIRAYCYSMICDLYGSGPFIDETMDVGTIPHQKTRQEIYDYVISETEELTTLLERTEAE